MKEQIEILRRMQQDGYLETKDKIEYCDMPDLVTTDIMEDYRENINKFLNELKR